MSIGTRWRKLALAGLALSAAAIAATSMQADAGDAVILVDPARRFQALEGWEVSIRGWEQNKAEDRYDPTWRQESEEVVRRLVEDAGINRVRLEVHSAVEAKTDHWRRFVDGEETYASWSEIRYANENDNKDPFTLDPEGFHWSELDAKVEAILLPMQALLAERGERLFVNLCIVDFRKGDHGELDLAAKPQEYAELVLAAFEHLKSKYGLAPDALEIMLEPENAQGWRPERLGPAIKAAKKRLAAAGHHPQIIGPSTVAAKNAVRYFDAAQRGGAGIDVLSYHSYDFPKDDVRAAIARRAEQAGVKTAMLEHLKADVSELHRDLTVANASAWQQWAIANFADNGHNLLVADLSKPKGERLRLARRTRFLSQIWRHARIGDVRVDAHSSDPELKPLAFVKPDGSLVVAVIAGAQREFAIEGLAPGDYAIEMTTDGARAKDAGLIAVGADGVARVSIPARGVVAIFPAQ